MQLGKSEEGKQVFLSLEGKKKPGSRTDPCSAGHPGHPRDQRPGAAQKDSWTSAETRGCPLPLAGSPGLPGARLVDQLTARRLACDVQGLVGLQVSRPGSRLPA